MGQRIIYLLKKGKNDKSLLESTANKQIVLKL